MNEEKKETKIINSIGMFDFVKGILMLAIIIGHSVTDYFHYWEYDFRGNVLLSILGSLASVFIYGLIPMFFMICGYGFRKTTVGRAAKNQFRYFWKPYMMVAIATAIIVVIKKLAISGDVLEGLRYQVLPYLFAFCPGEREFLGIYMDSIGPIWFFWVFVTAGILLNAILQEGQLWIQCVLVSILGCIGVSMKNIILPFCIQQAMVCSGYMFIGWLMKKQKFFEKMYPWHLMLLTVVFCQVAVISGGNIEVSQNVYANGVGDLIVSYVVGIMFMYWAVKIKCSEGVISRKVCWLGKNAMYICCIHTVAYNVIPWERLVNYLTDMKLIGAIVEMLLQFMFAIGGCAFIIEYQKKKRSEKGGLMKWKKV